MLNALPETPEQASAYSPSFALSMLTILLPPILMMLKTLAKGHLEAESTAAVLLNTVGDPIVSLLIAVLFAIWALGIKSGMNMA